MAVNSKIYPFNFLPGTKRDNTNYDGNYYSDSQWCRWYRGKPKKMGGYQSVYNGFTGIVRGEPAIYSKNNFSYVYGGSKSNLEMVLLNSAGDGGAYYDRTPAGLTASNNNEWKMTQIYNSAGSGMMQIAMATQTLSDITDSTNNKIYYGDVAGTSALTQLGNVEVSGGVCAIAPYLFVYGNDGYLAWSDKNAIANIGSGAGGDAGEARICSTKVVKGIPLRGTAGGAGLFFSLDTIQRVSYVGGTSIFNNTTLATQTSLLSTNAVIDYDGVIFWIANDRFMAYGGSVQEVPNDTHLDWFFNNYNKNFPQKIYATKVTRYGEIWFHFPFGQATECTHALIYNVREKCWYDTILPEGGRSAGLSPVSSFPNPLQFGVELSSSNKYRLWMHENNTPDKSVDGSTLAIESYFETPNIAFIDEGPDNSGGWAGLNRWTRLLRLEPDFVLTGGLDITVAGRNLAMASAYPPKTYNYDGVSAFKVDSRAQYREMTLKFRSNVQGGDYYMGKCLMELAPGDVRVTSGRDI